MRPRRFRPALAVALPALLCACAGRGLTPEESRAGITADDLAGMVRTLASDEFEGRGPASPGEERTVRYLQDRFKELGLPPGNGASYFQEVPLVALTADSAMTLTVRGRDGEAAYRYGDQIIAWTQRVTPVSRVERSDMVFVGYGIVAPEYGGNDYDGIDARGKTVVMLVNDPGFATQDPDLFTGNAMTYYGRWTYKYEEAARQGAAAAFIVHDTRPAAYPWEVVRGSWSGEKFGLVAEDDNMSRLAVEGWLTQEAARGVFRQAGLDGQDLAARAARRGFRAVPLGLNASIEVRNTIRRVTSRNVLALLPGAERPQECVVYMAHWDHLGRDASLEGDVIYNGALDNATGVAGLLELAAAFAALKQRPARSMLFLAATAEEQGLLGSAWYASHPVVPPERTAAVINMDGLNIWGPMRDITVVGFGKSELDDYLADAAREQGRTVRPDPEPEKGYFYRSDHFTLAKVGIPALYPDAGVDSVAHGEAWGLEQREAYTTDRYHKPSDEFDPAWDLSGAVDDLRLLFTVGERLAATSDFPNWRPGTEFRAARDAMMRH